MEEIVGISPTGVLGMDTVESSFKQAFRDFSIDFIGCDAGSSDAGPYYLGASASLLPTYTVRKTLELLLVKAREEDIPLLLGSAMTGGNRQQLSQLAAMTTEIASKHNLNFRMALIDSEIDHDYLRTKLRDQKISCFPYPAYPESIQEVDIDRSSHVVAQIGVAPFVEALEHGAEVVIAGRACDDAIFAAVPISRGFDPGLSIHMGKIMECAGASAEVLEGAIPGRTALIGRIRKDHFLVTPADERWGSIVRSVASHSFFERVNPIHQQEPEGITDLSSTEYEQVDARTVKVSGTKLIPTDKYRVKLEGAAPVGYRSICLAIARNPNVIERLDAIVEGVFGRVRDRFEGVDYKLNITRIGMNACLGVLEPNRTPASELGILLDSVAPSQEIATGVCGLARSVLTEGHYQGQKGHGGNVALPVVPFVIELGEAYEYSLWHLLELDNPLECVDISYVDV